MDAQVAIVPVLADNYAYIVTDRSGSAVAVVDPGDAVPVLEALEESRLRPNEIWLTHKHQDHIGGAVRIAHTFDALIRAPSEVPLLEARTARIGEGSTFGFGATTVKVFEVSGHTRGHVVYLLGNSLFCGDILFVGGCGRIFEGTPRDLHGGIERILATMPDHLRIYCGHEYAERNLRFAVDLEPSNRAAAKALALAGKLREEGRPMMPTELGRERGYNPFLRTREATLAEALRARYPDVPDSPEDIFVFLRRLRDAF